MSISYGRSGNNNFGIEMNKGNTVGFLGKVPYGIKYYGGSGESPLIDPILEAMIQANATLYIDMDKATGTSKGINAPFSDPIIDLANEIGNNKFGLFDYLSATDSYYELTVIPDGFESLISADGRAWSSFAKYQLKPNTSYTFTANNASAIQIDVRNSLGVRYFATSDISISETFTTDSDGKIGFKFIAPGAQLLNVMLNEGASVLPYEPYAKNNIDLNGFAGTTADGYDEVVEVIPFTADNQYLESNQVQFDGVVYSKTTDDNWTVNAGSTILSDRIKLIAGSSDFALLNPNENVLVPDKVVTVVVEIIATDFDGSSLRCRGNNVLSGIFTSDISFPTTVGVHAISATIRNAVTANDKFTFSPIGGTDGTFIDFNAYVYEDDVVGNIPTSGAIAIGNSKVSKNAMLKADGINSYGAIADNASLDPTGLEDFAICGVFKTGAILENTYLIAKNTDDISMQYSIIPWSDGRIYMRIGGVLRTIVPAGTLQTNTMYDIRVKKIGSFLKCDLNENEESNIAYTTSLVSHPNATLFGYSTSADGSTRGGFSNVYLGYLAFFYNGAKGLIEAGVDNACALAKAKYF